MGNAKLTVGLVICDSTAIEWQAIRTVLESFGVRVIVYLIGRPNDFIDVISGAVLYADIDHLLISAHGENKAILLPELAMDCYIENEPKVVQFNASLVETFGQLTKQLVLTTGCALGNSELAEAFLKIGSQQYIGPQDYIEGRAALLFVIRFYYELTANQRSEEDAFQLASHMDDETALFKLYKRLL